MPEPFVPEVPLPEVPEVPLPDVPLPLVPDVLLPLPIEPLPDVPEVVELPEPEVPEAPDAPVDPLLPVLLPVSELPAVFCLQPAAPRANVAAAKTAVTPNLMFFVFMMWIKVLPHDRPLLGNFVKVRERCATVASWSGTRNVSALALSPSGCRRPSLPHPGKTSRAGWEE